MRVLITNDDGVFAPGIKTLAEAALESGHDVLVVAPKEERSGSGAAMGVIGHGVSIHVDAYDMGLDGVEAWAVDGTPACCVLMAFFGVFGALPQIVLSGVNPGLNTGRGLLQSGTVGAVLTAADLGMTAAAFSIDHVGAERHWSTAAAVARSVLPFLEAAPRKTALNVNIPNRPLSAIEGVRWARISAFGATKMSMAGSIPGPVTVSVDAREVALKPDTDTGLVADGLVAVTALVTPRPTEPIDVSHIEAALRR